mgnify:CR=1 FL=1
MEFIVDSVNKTMHIGRQLGSLVNKGDILCLTGDLGTGKTHISKGIAEGLGIDEHITSPTFNIVNEYHSGRLTLYHFDVYRIGCSEEMYDIGFDEYIDSQGVCIIEWANIIEDILPEEYLKIELLYKETGREMILTPVGEKYEKIVEELTK